jgi:hypothetical protein
LPSACEYGSKWEKVNLPSRATNASPLPASGHRDEVVRRGELDIDLEVLLDALDRPQEDVPLGNEPDVHVDRRRSLADKDGRGTTREVAAAIGVGMMAERAHESPDAIPVG